MEADASASSSKVTEGAEELTEDVASFLRRNVPQIVMHGGSAAIRKLGSETGDAWIQLSGACGECNITSRTTRAIRSCLSMDLAGMAEVYIDTV